MKAWKRWTTLWAAFVAVGLWPFVAASVWWFWPIAPRVRVSGERFLAFSPDGRFFVTVDLQKGVSLRESTSAAVLVSRPGVLSAYRQVAISPDGGTLAVAVREEGVALWDGITLKTKAVLPTDGLPVSALQFSKDGHFLACSCSRPRNSPGPLIVWEAASCKERAKLSDGHKLQGFTPDGRSLVSLYEPRCEEWISVWDVATAKDRAKLRREGDFIRHFRQLEIAPTGKMLAVAYSLYGDMNTAGGAETEIWDVEAGRLLFVLSDVGKPLCFSPDGKYLATTCFNKTGQGISIKTWNSGDGTERACYEVYAPTVLATCDGLSYTPDGRSLAVLSDYTSKMPNLPSLDLKSGRITLDERPNNQAEVKLIDLTSGKQQISIQPKGLRALRTNGFVHYRMAFSSDGAALATSPSDDFGEVSLWDMPPRKNIVLIITVSLVIWLPIILCGSWLLWKAAKARS